MSNTNLVGHTQRNARISNLQIVLSLFRRSETLTIRDITEKTGLSKTAISKILHDLLSRNLITLAGKGSSSEGGGKRPDLYKLSTDKAFAITAIFLPTLIDVQLYNANLTLLDSEYQTPQNPALRTACHMKSEMISLVRSDSKAVFEYEEALSVLSDIIQKIIQNNNLLPAQIAGITVSSVGVVASDTGTLVTALISKVWPNNLPLVEDLRKRLPFSCHIHLDNVSRLGAYAFLWEKPERYHQNIVVLYCDNSVGGAYIRNGHLLHGKRSLIGEYGHITTDYTFKSRCVCGKNGCFESIVARSAIEARVCSELPKWPDSLLNSFPDAPHITISELFRAADLGDTLSCLQVDLIARQFSAMIYNFQIMYDPDEIIISAYSVPQNKYFINSIHRQMSFFANQSEMNITICPADSGGCYSEIFNSGAAAFCLDQYYTNEALADFV